MKFLVIGGLGFVGSGICNFLNKINEIDLSVIDNQSKGSLKNVEGVDLAFFPCDITDKSAISQTLGSINPEIVLHLAAMHFIPDCNQNPSLCLHTNVVGTENVLSACAHSESVRRVIVTSSQAVYGINDNPNREDDIPDPYDVYGESKLANELQARRFCKETGIDTTVVRLSNVYGPRETNPHVIPEIMTQLQNSNQILLGNIDPKRDFIHTTDVASAYTQLAINLKIKGFNLVNLGSGREYSIRELLDRLSKLLGKEIVYNKDLSRYRSTERMHLLADVSRIYDLVGWEPKVSIDQGLVKLCQWYKLI